MTIKRNSKWPNDEYTLKDVCDGNSGEILCYARRPLRELMTAEHFCDFTISNFYYCYSVTVTVAVNVTTTTTVIVNVTTATVIVNVTTATVIVNAPVTICVTVHFSPILFSCHRSYYCYCGFCDIKPQIYK